MIDSKTVIYPTKNNHAFTIIELLIVIVVIGILVAISVVSYLGIQSRARDAVNETNISGIFKSVEMHKAQKIFTRIFFIQRPGDILVGLPQMALLLLCIVTLRLPTGYQAHLC